MQRVKFHYKNGTFSNDPLETYNLYVRLFDTFDSLLAQTYANGLELFVEYENTLKQIAQNGSQTFTLYQFAVWVIEQKLFIGKRSLLINEFYDFVKDKLDALSSKPEPELESESEDFELVLEGIVQKELKKLPEMLRDADREERIKHFIKLLEVVEKYRRASHKNQAQ